jgi:hypothetical protein
MMENNYSISEETWLRVLAGLSKNKHWVAFDINAPDINKESILLFKKKSQAIEFVALCKIYEKEIFIFHATSIDEVYRHLEKIQHEHSISLTINNTIMNEKNLEFISKQLKQSGFGEALNNELKEKIESQVPEFTLAHESSFDNDRLTATLQFRKSAESDMYFFNRVEMSVKNERDAESLKQSFYANNNITPNEGYNLIQGRAVYKEMTGKEGNKYNAWVQLNFKETDQYGNFKMKQFHDNYGFDLKATLEKYGVKELPTSENSVSLIESLKRGNREAVTMVKEGNEQKVFIEASPRFKSLNLYDGDMKRVNMKNLSEKKTESQSQGESKKQSAKQQTGDGGDGMNKGEKRKQRQRQTLS